MSPSERDFHRKMAVECFNKTWKYLKKQHRTSGDDRLMLNLAHSSRFHWNLVGKASNFAIGDWQISRVYSTLNQPDLAIRFARTSLETCRKNRISGWLLASAYEGLARAYVAKKDYRSAGEYLDKARQQLRSEDVEEDLKTISHQIDETERMIKE